MKPRLRMHRFPGSVSRQKAAMMLEGKWPEKRRSKSFKSGVRMKERAVLKRRWRIDEDSRLSSME